MSHKPFALIGSILSSSPASLLAPDLPHFPGFFEKKSNLFAINKKQFFFPLIPAVRQLKQIACVCLLHRSSGKTKVWKHGPAPEQLSMGVMGWARIKSFPKSILEMAS